MQHLVKGGDRKRCRKMNKFGDVGKEEKREALLIAEKRVDTDYRGNLSRRKSDGQEI